MSSRQNTKLDGIRDIFVALTEEGHGDEAYSSITYGLALAEVAGAHLTVQAASKRIVAVGALFPSVTRALIASENQRVSALAQVVAERAATGASMAGVVCTTETLSLSYPDLLARVAWQARLHDLTILDAEARAIDVDRELIEAVLFASGRPVLVVPPSTASLTVRRLMIAWDGSAPAARAVSDALPFLRAAEEVEVVSVVGEKEFPTSAVGSEIAPHLSRHGVTVTVTELPLQGTAFETLHGHVLATRADMLVMGAFRHSRLRDWFFGGVTQSFLKRTPVPLFLAH